MDDSSSRYGTTICTIRSMLGKLHSVSLPFVRSSRVPSLRDLVVGAIAAMSGLIALAYVVQKVAS